MVKEVGESRRAASSALATLGIPHMKAVVSGRLPYATPVAVSDTMKGLDGIKTRFISRTARARSQREGTRAAPWQRPFRSSAAKA